MKYYKSSAKNNCEIWTGALHVADGNLVSAEILPPTIERGWHPSWMDTPRFQDTYPVDVRNVLFDRSHLNGINLDIYANVKRCSIPRWRRGRLRPLEDDWNEDEMSHAKACSRVFYHLNDREPDVWQFVGLKFGENVNHRVMDCHCRMSDILRREGCSECHSKKVSVEINEDATYLKRRCHECSVESEHVVEACQCGGFGTREEQVEGIFPVGVFVHNPTGLLFHLVPGQSGTSHSKYRHFHSNGASHNCGFPNASCCCPYGSEDIEPFLISVDHVRWGEGMSRSPSIIGFANNIGYFDGLDVVDGKPLHMGSLIQSLVSRHVPIFNLNRSDVRAWLHFNGLDLPTSAESSHARRAGNPTSFSTGNFGEAELAGLKGTGKMIDREQHRNGFGIRAYQVDELTIDSGYPSDMGYFRAVKRIVL